MHSYDLAYNHKYFIAFVKSKLLNLTKTPTTHSLTLGWFLPAIFFNTFLSMAYSNISVTLDQTQLSQILTQVKALKTSLSFLIGLTPEEKKRMRKMGDKLTSYVLDVRTLASTYPGSLPSDVNVPEFSKDVDLIVKLDAILAELRPLYNKLEDTSIAVGNESIRVADVCYGFLKYAVRNNPSLGESVRVLGARFKRAKVALKPDAVIAK